MRTSLLPETRFFFSRMYQMYIMGESHKIPGQTNSTLPIFKVRMRCNETIEYSRLRLLKATFRDGPHTSLIFACIAI